MTADDHSAGEPSYRVHPVGYVRRRQERIMLELLEPYRAALRYLDRFGHVIVLWWIDEHDDEESRSTLQTATSYLTDDVAGVFASRSPLRPNPLGLTPCEIVSVDQEAGIVQVVNIDAREGTPILDLKAYIPAVDRVRRPKTPAWLDEWPQWMPEEGHGL